MRSDWSIVRFLGSEQGWNAVKEGMDQMEEGSGPRPASPEDEVWAAGKGASRNSRRGSKSEEQKQQPVEANDAEAEPPELV